MDNNILIIGRSNIGDVCYDLLLVKALREHFLNAKISFLTSSHSANIVDGYPGVSRIVTFDKHLKDKGLSGRMRLMSLLNKQKFSLAIVLRSTLMHKFLNIPVSWSFQDCCRKYKLALKKNHIVDAYLQFLKINNVSVGQPLFNFRLACEEDDFSKTFLKKHKINSTDKFITILPFSAWSLKNWPVAKWNELAGKLNKKYQIRLINLSKKSSNYPACNLSKQISQDIVSGEETTLKQAMALIKRSSLFIGPDSSLLHLSSCLGVETIGLYGPTSIERFYPYFHRKDVMTARKKRDCVFCYPYGKKRLCDKEFVYGACMEDIEVDDVVEKVEKKLGTTE